MRLMRQMEKKHWLQEGIQEGIALNIYNLMDTMKLSLSQAMEALKIPDEEKEKYAARIQKL